MALRMHRVSPARWSQLAASRLPIDLTTEEGVEPEPDRRHTELAEIQTKVDTLTARRSRVRH